MLRRQLLQCRCRAYLNDVFDADISMDWLLRDVIAERAWHEIDDNMKHDYEATKAGRNYGC